MSEIPLPPSPEMPKEPATAVPVPGAAKRAPGDKNADRPVAPLPPSPEMPKEVATAAPAPGAAKRAPFPGLSGTVLKVIALVSMTVDHAGVLLFPACVPMRAIGRLAFPLFACMVGEGARHTRSLPRYLGGLAAMGLLCQLVYFLTAGSLYQNIFVTLSMAVALIAAFSRAKTISGPGRVLLPAAALLAAAFVCYALPALLPGTDFAIDYAFPGVLLPLLYYLPATRWGRLAGAAGGTLALCLFMGGVQWWALCALPLLALYNGRRGRGLPKLFFYLYYPLHMAALQALSSLLY